MRRLLVAAAAALALTGPALAETAGVLLGDAERGAQVFRKCSGCHQVGPGAVNRSGPHLNGVFGRKAGALGDFDYSSSMERAAADGLVWDLERLDAYIENPRALVSGTRMSFRGLKDKSDRDDVLAYLRRLEGLDNRLGWVVLEYDAENWPAGEATIRVRTLSLEPAWLGV